MNHESIDEVFGLEDGDSPFLTIRHRCSCGHFLIERTYDVREYDSNDVEADGEADALLFVAHLEGVPA